MTHSCPTRLSSDLPPGELNRQTSKGQHFVFPWYGGGDVRTNEYADSEPPADVVFPAVAMQAHAADLGMHFYRGDQFPQKYRGGIFSAQHGSWNRTTPVGAQVMFRSEEHTSELQSLMRISSAVFCLTKKNVADDIHTEAQSLHQSNND